MADIGKLNVKIIGDSSGFTSAAEKATASAANFAKQLEKQAATYGMTSRQAKIYSLEQKGASQETLAAARAADQHITALEKQAAAAKKVAQAGGSSGIMSTLGQKAMNMLPGGIGGAASGGPMAMAMTAATAATQEFLRLAEMGKNEILSVARSADTLGLSYKQMAGFSVMAGGDLEHATKSLEHFSRLVGESQAGSKEAALKFQQMGVAAKDLKDLSGAYDATSNSIRNMATREQQLAAIQETFGREAATNQRFVAGIIGGAEGMKAAEGRAEQHGHVRTPEEVETLRQNARMLQELKLSEKGLAEESAMAFAPVEKFWNVFKLGWQGGLNQLPKNPLKFFHGVIDAVDKATDDMKRAKDRGEPKDDKKNPTAGPATAAIQRMTLALQEQAEGFRVTADAAAFYKLNLAGVDQKKVDDFHRAQAAALLGGMHSQTEAFGMNPRELDILKAERSGTPAAAVQQARAMAEQLKLLERITSITGSGLNYYDQWIARVNALVDALHKSKLEADAFHAGMKKANEEFARAEAARDEQVKTEALTPLDRFNAAMKEADVLAKKIKLNGELLYTEKQIAVQRKKAYDELLRSSDLTSTELPRSIHAGSQEDFTARAQGQLTARLRKDPAQILEQIKAQEAANAAAQRLLLTQIVQAIANNQFFEVAMQ